MNKLKIGDFFKNPVIEFYDERINMRPNIFPDHITLIDFKNLYPTQDDLDQYCLANKYFHLKEEATKILVVYKDDKLLIINGHHTATAMYLKGINPVPAKVIDYNYIEDLFKPIERTAEQLAQIEHEKAQILKASKLSLSYINGII